MQQWPPVMDSRSNTLARLKLLTKALKGDQNIPFSFAKACLSQGGLAKYLYESEGINPMALNTLKSSADLYIEDGGWKTLDSMRRSYLSMKKNIIKSELRPERSNSAKQKDMLHELQNTLDLERRYRIQIQVAYETILERLRMIAQADPELASFVNRHVSVFSFKRITLTNKILDANED